MITDELKQEAEECMHNALFWLKLPISKDNVEKGGSYILELLEPREKRTAELEEAKANLEYLLEGRDNEIDELKKENKNLAQNLEDTEICENGWKNRVKQLEAQIEKMKCDVLSIIKDRMNDDIDQNIIERLAEKWEMIEK